MSSFLSCQIQQAAERPERNFVDTRQLKVCATCFDLSVSLLRVLEMTITLVPEIFLDWTRPSAELLLRRLAQVSLIDSWKCCSKNFQNLPVQSEYNEMYFMLTINLFLKRFHAERWVNDPVWSNLLLNISVYFLRLLQCSSRTFSKPKLLTTLTKCMNLPQRVITWKNVFHLLK